jgi:hypothetical protein
MKLPISPSGNNSIAVFVDHLSKYAIFLPCKEEGTDAPTVADLRELLGRC